MVRKFRYLKVALACVLLLVGVKVLAVLATGVLASLWVGRESERAPDGH